MIKTVEQTPKHKTIRVIKYTVILFAFIIISAILDSIIYHYFDDPWIDFKNDWMVLQGAMMYRLISTWGYK